MQQALERYIETYGQELINAAPHAPVWLGDYWVADWQQPTLEDLQQLGLLSSAFTHFSEPPAHMWVFPQEPCHREPCFLHALVVANEPLQKSSGVADAQALGVWREVTGGEGLVVQAPYEQWLAAAHFRWPNNFAGLGALPEGSIALAVNGEQLWNRYLRVRDERDPQFQNQLTVRGQIHSQTALRSEGHIVMGLEAVAGDECNDAGAMAHDAHFPIILLCRDGKWKRSIDQDGGYFIVNQYGDCVHPELGSTLNSMIGSCSCPAAYDPMVIAAFYDLEDNRYYTYLCRLRGSSY